MTAWLAEPSLLIAKNKRSAAQGDLRRTQQQNSSGPLSFGAVVANGAAGAAVLVGVRAGAADRRRLDSRETEKTRRAAKASWRSRKRLEAADAATRTRRDQFHAVQHSSGGDGGAGDE